MKLIVTETEGLKIQQVLLDMLHEYNAGFANPQYDLDTLVTEHSEKIEEIFEQDPLSKWHKEQ